MNSIGASDAIRPRMQLASEVEDPLLADLNDEAALGAESATGAFSPPADALLGTAPPSAPRPLDDFRSGPEAPPYDVEVVRPRVIDLRQLYALAGRPLPDEIEATLGPNRPLLVCHGVTPFHRPGARPSSIWGLGYEALLSDVDSTTIAFCPQSQTRSVGSVEQSLQVGIGAGGELDVPQEALQIVGAIPGVTLTGAELGITTNTRLALALSFTLALRAVEAGPVGAGGVRWNIYQTKDRLDCYQPLFQTLLVRHSEPELKFRLRTWVRSRGFFGLGAKQWRSDWVEFTVPLRGSR